MARWWPQGRRRELAALVPQIMALAAERAPISKGALRNEAYCRGWPEEAVDRALRMLEGQTELEAALDWQYDEAMGNLGLGTLADLDGASDALLVSLGMGKRDVQWARERAAR